MKAQKIFQTATFLRRLCASTLRAFLSLLLMLTSFFPSVAVGGTWKERGVVKQVAMAVPASGFSAGQGNLSGGDWDSARESWKKLREERRVLAGKSGAARALGRTSERFGRLQRVSENVSSADSRRRWLVLIQDAHQIESAQKNTAKFLSELNTEKEKAGIGGQLLVGVEGSTGGYRIAEIRKHLTIRQSLETAAEFLLHNNLINGAEYFGLLAEPQAELFGAESQDLYLANVNAYREAQKHNSFARASLSRLKANLYNHHRPELSAQGQKLSALLQSYDNQKTKLSDFVMSLQTFVSSEKLEKYTELAKLSQVHRLEKSLSFAQVEKERSQVLNELSRKLSSTDQETLASWAAGYRLGEVKSVEFYQKVESYFQKAGIATEKYPAFKAYTQYLLEAEKIDSSRLQEEVEGLKQEVIAAVSEGRASERAYFELRADLRLAEHLVQSALTPAEQKVYAQRKADLWRLPERLSAAEISGEWTQALKDYAQFYAYSDQRESALLENLQKKAQSQDLTVLIAGGYHTANLEKLAQAQGWSVAVWSPNLDANIKNAVGYLDFFLKKPTPASKLLLGEKLMLNVSGALVSAPSADASAQSRVGAAGTALAATYAASAAAGSALDTKHGAHTDAGRGDGDADADDAAIRGQVSAANAGGPSLSSLHAHPFGSAGSDVKQAQVELTILQADGTQRDFVAWVSEKAGDEDQKGTIEELHAAMVEAGARSAGVNLADVKLSVETPKELLTLQHAPAALEEWHGEVVSVLSNLQGQAAEWSAPLLHLWNAAQSEFQQILAAFKSPEAWQQFIDSHRNMQDAAQPQTPLERAQREAGLRWIGIQMQKGLDQARARTTTPSAAHLIAAKAIYYFHGLYNTLARLQGWATLVTVVDELEQKGQQYSPWHKRKDQYGTGVQTKYVGAVYPTFDASIPAKDRKDGDYGPTTQEVKQWQAGLRALAQSKPVEGLQEMEIADVESLLALDASGTLYLARLNGTIVVIPSKQSLRKGVPLSADEIPEYDIHQKYEIAPPTTDDLELYGRDDAGKKPQKSRRPSSAGLEQYADKKRDADWNDVDVDPSRLKVVAAEPVNPDDLDSETAALARELAVSDAKGDTKSGMAANAERVSGIYPYQFKDHHVLLVKFGVHGSQWRSVYDLDKRKWYSSRGGFLSDWRSGSEDRAHLRGVFDSLTQEGFKPWLKTNAAGTVIYALTESGAGKHTRTISVIDAKHSTIPAKGGLMRERRVLWNAQEGYGIAIPPIWASSFDLTLHAFTLQKDQKSGQSFLKLQRGVYDTAECHTLMMDRSWQVCCRGGGGGVYQIADMHLTANGSVDPGHFVKIFDGMPNLSVIGFYDFRDLYIDSAGRVMWVESDIRQWRDLTKEFIGPTRDYFALYDPSRPVGESVLWWYGRRSDRIAATQARERSRQLYQQTAQARLQQLDRATDEGAKYTTRKKQFPFPKLISARQPFSALIINTSDDIKAALQDFIYPLMLTTDDQRPDRKEFYVHESVFDEFIAEPAVQVLMARNDILFFVVMSGDHETWGAYTWDDQGAISFLTPTALNEARARLAVESDKKQGSPSVVAVAAPQASPSTSSASGSSRNSPSGTPPQSPAGGSAGTGAAVVVASGDNLLLEVHQQAVQAAAASAAKATDSEAVGAAAGALTGAALESAQITPLSGEALFGFVSEHASKLGEPVSGAVVARRTVGILQIKATEALSLGISKWYLQLVRGFSAEIATQAALAWSHLTQISRHALYNLQGRSRAQNQPFDSQSAQGNLSQALPHLPALDQGVLSELESNPEALRALLTLSANWKHLLGEEMFGPRQIVESRAQAKPESYAGLLESLTQESKALESAEVVGKDLQQLRSIGFALDKLVEQALLSADSDGRVEAESHLAFILGLLKAQFPDVAAVVEADYKANVQALHRHLTQAETKAGWPAAFEAQVSLGAAVGAQQSPDRKRAEVLLVDGRGVNEVAKLSSGFLEEMRRQVKALQESQNRSDKPVVLVGGSKLAESLQTNAETQQWLQDGYVVVVDAEASSEYQSGDQILLGQVLQKANSLEAGRTLRVATAYPQDWSLSGVVGSQVDWLVQLEADLSVHLTSDQVTTYARNLRVLREQQ